MSKPFRIDHGYPCRYTPTIQDGPVFRWGTEFEISASRNGVIISGHSWCLKGVGLTRVQKVIEIAEQVFLQLEHNDRREVIRFAGEEVGNHKWLSPEEEPPRRINPYRGQDLNPA